MQVVDIKETVGLEMEGQGSSLFGGLSWRQVRKVLAAGEASSQCVVVGLQARLTYEKERRSQLVAQSPNGLSFCAEMAILTTQHWH